MTPFINAEDAVTFVGARLRISGVVEDGARYRTITMPEPPGS
jgi:hypothetical protein